MDAVTRAGYLAHAQSPSFRRKVSATQEILLAHLDGRSYVSFSAGKDSAVVADLCHRQRPGVPILMVDPGCPFHWLKDERAAWIAFSAQRGWALRLFPWDKWGAVSGADSIERHQAAAHKSMFIDLHAYAAEHDLSQRVTGMRAAESWKRGMWANRRGAAYTLSDGTRVLNPIVRWTVSDVWAWILTHDLPWLSIYDHIGPAARNGLIGRSGIDQGRLGWLKMYYPEAYARAREVMPLEVAQYGG